MIKVITYGTFDMLHYGHIRLLERAKALGDYLIVGVTSDDFDKTRGKINLQQSLSERVEAIRNTGFADKIVIEEYEGQKIDDIKRYNIDIFTVGSDWEGYFDYLKEYCKVIYLERTKGISSSGIRSEKALLKLGLVGSASFLEKIVKESTYVNGVNISGICTDYPESLSKSLKDLSIVTDNLDDFLCNVDAVYIHSFPKAHYLQVKKALLKGKHVLCESPLALNRKDCFELYKLAENNHVILMEAIKTAYSTAYQRLLLMLKAGKIGHVVSVDATCTSLKSITTLSDFELDKKWNSLATWGPTGLLPVFQILGTSFKCKNIISHIDKNSEKFDTFTKIEFVFPNSVASVKVGRGVKSEGELVVSGTKGYIYVPSPWWKTDYFEIRYENPVDNKRYFYQLDGEGIRYELVSFLKSIQTNTTYLKIDQDISLAISEILQDFYDDKDVIFI